MFKTTKEGLSLWQFDSFSCFSDQLVHFVSGREGGISFGADILNLSFSVMDQEDNVRANRARVARALGVGSEKLFFPNQTHSANIKIIDANSPIDLSDTDALVTNVKGICIAVMSADCVPVLLYDKENKVIAAIHAGWRGTVAGIVSKTIALMMEKFGSQPDQLMAGIGPSICNEVYEVGEEVLREVRAYYKADSDSIISRESNGKGHIDLWQANKLQLLHAGVDELNIEVSQLCTYLNHDEFFSVRKSTNCGRFAAGVMLRP